MKNSSLEEYQLNRLKKKKKENRETTISVQIASPRLKNKIKLNL